MNAVALGKRIKGLRKLKRMTQQQLADRLDLSPSLLSNIERGLKEAKPELLEKMAATLNVHRDDFF
jgi:transcriptional regulator with XRE-family HTH domain